MADVVSIRDGVEIVPPGTPRPALVELAEKLLEMARSGELQAVAVVRYHADETHTYEFEGRTSYGTLGALENLKFEMMGGQRP